MFEDFNYKNTEKDFILELKKKQALGRDLDENELRIINDDKETSYRINRGFSQRVEALHDLQRESSPHFKLVNVGEINHVQISKETGDGVIWTKGLNGCICSVVVVEYLNGEKYVLLSHYPPTMVKRNVSLIEENLKKLEGKGVVCNKHALLFVKNVYTPIVGDLYNSISINVSTIEKIPYNEPDKNKIDAGVIILDVPAGKDNRVHYKTWFNEGYI
jgi:hypothetical protein